MRKIDVNPSGRAGKWEAKRAGGLGRRDAQDGESWEIWAGRLTDSWRTRQKREGGGRGRGAQKGFEADTRLGCGWVQEARCRGGWARVGFSYGRAVGCWLLVP